MTLQEALLTECFKVAGATEWSPLILVKDQFRRSPVIQPGPTAAAAKMMRMPGFPQGRQVRTLLNVASAGTAETAKAFAMAFLAIRNCAVHDDAGAVGWDGRAADCAGEAVFVEE